MTGKDTLTNSDIKKLVHIGKDIVLSLSCDINGIGLPCHTDRMEAIKGMVEYLRVHDYKLTPPDLK